MLRHLDQRQLNLNRQRFCAVAVEQDLFGGWRVLHRWGRIGTLGRGLGEVFATIEAAEEAALHLIHIKISRGREPGRQTA